MGNKLLKKEDYLELVVLIYKFSKLNKKTLQTLVKYASYQLYNNRFSSAYFCKLLIDTHTSIRNMDGVQVFTEEQITMTTKELESKLSQKEFMSLKAQIWEILNRGYYS